jgi:hypothetical protein
MSNAKKSLIGATLAVSLLSSVVAPQQAFALPAPVVVVKTASSPLWVAGGFLGFVATLGVYDLVRRTTCAGDFLNLGGPGFSQPMKATDNALTPACPPRKR